MSVTKETILKGKEKDGRRKYQHLGERTSVVDPEFEYIDPTPDIHAMFIQFNKRFFRGRLQAVVVKWSSRMTSDVGICDYEGEGGLCTIRLSEPLLKLRPRKDLVETLLHEMIHAYLFIRKKDRDRHDHGPQFHKYMHRINAEAGTNISVYHDFEDEVVFYKQHWWRCNGPCRAWEPDFGTVKRSRDQPPGPRDPWWRRHHRMCGGRFVQVREPGCHCSTGDEVVNSKSKLCNCNMKATSSKNETMSRNSAEQYKHLSRDDHKCLAVHNENKCEKKDSASTVEDVQGSDTVTCPMCDQQFSRDILTFHLEDCIQCVSGDNTGMDEKCIVKSENCGGGDQPCPVCRRLVQERSMNTHLDECLSVNVINEMSQSDLPN